MPLVVWECPQCKTITTAFLKPNEITFRICRSLAHALQGEGTVTWTDVQKVVVRDDRPEGERGDGQEASALIRIIKACTAAKCKTFDGTVPASEIVDALGVELAGIGTRQRRKA